MSWPTPPPQPIANEFATSVLRDQVVVAIEHTRPQRVLDETYDDIDDRVRPTDAPEATREASGIRPDPTDDAEPEQELDEAPDESRVRSYRVEGSSIDVSCPTAFRSDRLLIELVRRQDVRRIATPLMGCEQPIRLTGFTDLPLELGAYRVAITDEQSRGTVAVLLRTASGSELYPASSKGLRAVDFSHLEPTLRSLPKSTRISIDALDRLVAGGEP